MKILVIGGMHGNEPLGLAVAELLLEQPLSDVDVLLANEQAISQRVRFTNQDLNRSFPGNKNSDIYEFRRAAQILEKAKQYDIVLDFHNTYCPENDCGFVGEGAKSKLYDATKHLGFSRVIVADYDCINKFANNCISVEVSMDSEMNDPQLWYQKISTLSKMRAIKPGPEIEKFKFIYRMTLEDKERLQLDKYDFRAFQQMPPELAESLGVNSPAYPIFIGDKFTQYNYGGVLNRIEVEHLNLDDQPMQDTTYVS